MQQSLLKINFIVGSPAVAGRFLWIRVCPCVWPSLRPSVLLSGNFLRIVSLVFSETLYGVRGSIWRCAWQRPIFSKKSPFGKNDQQCSKMTQSYSFWVFESFRETYWLVLPGNGAEWKYLWPCGILRKPHMREKSGSQVTAKKWSRPIRFQYSLTVNISLMDWHLTLIFCM